MNVVVEEKNGKWEILTDGICYDRYDTEPEAQEVATRIRRNEGLMDKLKVLVNEQTRKWDEADKDMFRNLYGKDVAEASATGT